MTVVFHLDRCLDLRTEQNVPSAAVSALEDQDELLLQLKVVQTQDVEHLVSYDAQRPDGVGVSELGGSTSIHTRFDRWIRSKLRAMKAFTQAGGK